MRESRVVTEVYFEPSQGFDVRGSLTFSDATKIRLDPSDLKLKLKLNEDFRYPTDSDLSVRSRTFEPEALREILIVDLVASTPEGTSVALRIYDGTDELYWDGAAWSTAGAGDWNTEAEVNANLASLDVSARKFGLVFNLVTTDDRYTPSVEGAKVLWRGPIDWHDDVLIDSLTRMFADEVRYVERLALPPLEADSASIDLDDYAHEHELEFSDADTVFDEDADAAHAVDLLAGYDAGTRVLTLSSAIPAGNRPYLRMLAAPSVAWDTAQDFSELARLPSIVLRDARAVSSSRYPFRSETGVVRKDTGAAVKTSAPWRMTWEVTISVSVDRSRAQMALLDQLVALFSDGPSGEVGPFLRTRATDRRYRMRLIDEFRASDPKINLADVRTFESTFRIEDTALELSSARDMYAVTQFNLDFSAVPSDTEAAAVAADAPVPSTDAERVEVS